MKKNVFKRTGAMLLALSLAWGSLSGIAHAETATKPENGITEGQPFRPGTGGKCRTYPIWVEFYQIVNAYFDQKTLADMIRYETKTDN